MPIPRKRIDKQSQNRKEVFKGKHRFEHWYVSNQIYLITACVRDHQPAFQSCEARDIFWTKFDQYTRELEFFPWVCTLLHNHYHVVGYNRHGANIPKLMQRLHGSVAKLVNDTLETRITDFWRDQKGRECFDGCLRDPLQTRRSYGYVL